VYLIVARHLLAESLAFLLGGTRAVLKRFPTAVNVTSAWAGAIKIQRGSGLGGWTLDTLDEGHELEQFMAGVPGFYYQSKAWTTAKAILGSLSGPNGLNAMLPWKMLKAVEHTSDV
jgi:hypothetical protein